MNTSVVGFRIPGAHLSHCRRTNWNAVSQKKGRARVPAPHEIFSILIFWLCNAIFNGFFDQSLHLVGCLFGEFPLLLTQLALLLAKLSLFFAKCAHLFAEFGLAFPGARLTFAEL